ncbi:hypothetical protein AS888_19325 [Peribacillus simplex]|uniref:Uncharacterized protein n=1 Tax=Peribacillus simplex TaxID=1478 RepID=A0A109MYT0_9BACI|nr:hypothetical protein AS888_19325 [Peribacillus simplex]
MRIADHLSDKHQLSKIEDLRRNVSLNLSLNKRVQEFMIVYDSAAILSTFLIEVTGALAEDRSCL